MEDQIFKLDNKLKSVFRFNIVNIALLNTTHIMEI